MLEPFHLRVVKCSARPRGHSANRWRVRFRSREDRLAFAVHAYLLADGYKLVAVGKDADEAPAGAWGRSLCAPLPVSGKLESLTSGYVCAADSAGSHLIHYGCDHAVLCCGADADLTDDVPPDGWNSLDGTYAFRYVDPSGTKPPLLVKALSVGMIAHRHNQGYLLLPHLLHRIFTSCLIFMLVI